MNIFDLGDLGAVIVDLDHTLLSPERTISPENRNAFERLKMLSLPIILASGRPWQQMISFQRELDIKGPMICSNGSVVYDSDKGCIVHEVLMSLSETSTIISFADDLELSVYSYHAQGVYVWKQRHWNEFDAGHEADCPTFFYPPKIEPAQKVFISVSQEEALHYRDKIEILTSALGLVLWHGWPETIEVQPKTAEKLQAWLRTAVYLGVSPKGVLVFGDGENDIQLLKWGFGVAMSNGCAGAKQAANEVAAPGPEDTSFARAVSLFLP